MDKKPNHPVLLAKLTGVGAHLARREPRALGNVMRELALQADYFREV
jgi:hypothetical protein